MAFGTFLEGFLVSSAILYCQLPIQQLLIIIPTEQRHPDHQYRSDVKKLTYNTTGNGGILPSQHVDICLRIPSRIIVKSVCTYTTAFLDLRY